MKNKSENKSINPVINQLIRNFTIPSGREKAKVLDIILLKINSNEHQIINQPYRISFQLKLVATVIGFLIFSSILLTGYNSQTLTTTLNDGSFRLPDNSRVVLAGNSTLKIHKLIGERQVSLTGTAYFEVEHGGKFIVSSGKSKVTVLGTRFSIENNNGRIRVECFDGRLKVSLSGTESIVNAGNILSGNESSGGGKAFETSSGNLPSFARFEKNYLAADIRQVIHDLSAFFDVSLIYEGTDSRNLSGTFDTGNRDEALEILCTSMNLRFEKVSENTIKIY